MIRFLLPGVLSRPECAETIAAAEAQGFAATGRHYPDLYRNNDRAVLDDPALAARLFERVSPSLPEVWEENGGRWTLHGLNPRFRFCRYRDGQHFTRHRDGAWAPSPERRSWLTLMLYLNDAAELTGGATRFFRDEGIESVPPSAGQGIVFDHRLWHDGEAVTRGTKYVLRTDVLYDLERAAPALEPTRSGLLSCERVLAGHTGYVWVVRRLADGRLVTGSRDGTVRAWGSGEVLREGLGESATALIEVEGRLWVGGRTGQLNDGARTWQAHAGAVLGLERAPDDAVISSGADGRVVRWSPTGEASGELARDAGWVWGTAFDAAQLRVATEPTTAIVAGASGTRTGELKVLFGRSWHAHDGAVTALLQVDTRWVSAGEDGAVRLWSADGELLGEGLHRDFVRSLVQVDPTRIASASYDSTAVIWQIAR